MIRCSKKLVCKNISIIIILILYVLIISLCDIRVIYTKVNYFGRFYFLWENPGMRVSKSVVESASVSLVIHFLRWIGRVLRPEGQASRLAERNKRKYRRRKNGKPVGSGAEEWCPRVHNERTIEQRKEKIGRSQKERTERSLRVGRLLKIIHHRQHLL